MRMYAHNFPLGLNTKCYIQQVFEELKEHSSTEAGGNREQLVGDAGSESQSLVLDLLSQTLVL